MIQHDLTAPGYRNVPGGLAYTTVTAIPSRLQAKCAVTWQNDGQAFAWEATADQVGPRRLSVRWLAGGSVWTRWS